MSKDQPLLDAALIEYERQFNLNGEIRIVGESAAWLLHFLSESSRKSVPSESGERDAARWRFCMKHGFPKHCFNPEHQVHYFYIRGDFCSNTAFGWATPEQAVDGTMQAIKEYEDAERLLREETQR